jgi:hypothetical protein
MKKLAVAFIYTAALSSAQAAMPRSEHHAMQPPRNYELEDPAILSGPIPIKLLDIQFDQCVEQHSELGSALVGSYCQCVSTEYYQNLPYLAFLRFADDLISQEDRAIKYQQRTSSNCFTAIARSVGPR